MRRKAQFLLAKEIVPMIATFIIVSIGIGLFTYLTLGNKPSTENVDFLTKEINAYQLVNNDQCFAYADPKSGAVKPYIDAKKFTNAQLQKCTLFGNPPYQTPALATLTNTDTGKTIQVTTMEWQEGIIYQEMVYPVLIINGTNNITRGILEVRLA